MKSIKCQKQQLGFQSLSKNMNYFVFYEMLWEVFTSEEGKQKHSHKNPILYVQYCISPEEQHTRSLKTQKSKHYLSCIRWKDQNL